MKAIEIWNRFKNMNNPNDIFDIYEDALKLAEEEKEELRKMGIGDSIDMQYITAVEMKKKGIWDAYLERWDRNKNKTGGELLGEYMHQRGLKFPGR